MWQQITVYIIGGLLAVYVVWRLVRLFTGRAHGNDPCAGCSGCDLRSEFLKKRQECLRKGIQGSPAAKRKSRSKNPTGCNCG